ncbi:MAG: DUF350 domain-containing protein [Spirochaetales bacterium]|nr:DUF350 domain-containing protein [Spirochaetales bacterium]
MKARIFTALLLFSCVVSMAVFSEEVQPVQRTDFNWILLIYVAIVSLLGIVLLVVGYFVWELVTPYSVKVQLLEQKNTAVAIVAASFVLGMAIIIAAAVLVFH